MRLALLGIDDAILEVTKAAAQSGQDEVVMYDASAARGVDVAALGLQARQIDAWEFMLDSNEVDAVLVAADNQELRIEQLRRMIQAGIPVLVSHPISLSMLQCYELDMIRQETNGVVLPYLTSRWHPAPIQLLNLIEDQSADGEAAVSSIGSVEQILCERSLERRDRDNVLRQFARDADLLQFLAGDATKLHALGAGTSGSSASHAYANLAVQMTSEKDLVCRWNVVPIEGQPGGRLTLVGSQGKAILWMPASEETWQLEIRSHSGSSAGMSNLNATSARPLTVHEYPGWIPGAAALERLAAAIKGEPVNPTWSNAARTVELAESIQSSMRRGRTIDLHQEEFSDLATFKGTMASAGCGLLLVGLALVVFVALAHVVAAQAGWKGLADVLDHWPYLLLAVCGIYLALQFFLLVGKPPHNPTDISTPLDKR